MENVRIVIVDDSSFSIAFIRDILEQKGLEVVGTAGTLEEVKAVVKETKPNLVTMDMTLPGTDGLECTRAIHEIDKDVKVIVISSMKDDEIVKEAKRNRVSAYIQKPVDSEELITVITRLMASDELYRFLQEEYIGVFKEALMDSMNRTTKTLLTYEDKIYSDKEYMSEGMDILVGIIGKFSGRMILGFSKETANKLAAAVLRREPKNNNEMTDMLGEFANIISGIACSVLNMKNKALGLRVAPPSVLNGDNVLISSPDFVTTTVKAKTDFGMLSLNVGFKRGDEIWI